MKKQLLTVLAVAVIGLAAGGSSALAQSLVMDVDFEFKVGETAMSPGTYEIKRGDQGTSLVIKNTETGEVLFVNYITRLSSREDRKGAAVFDKANGTSYLSEIYLPGLDGYHLQGAPGDHAHAVVKAKN